MAAAPRVGIRDDGELADVRSLLNEMKIAYAEGNAVEPTRLLFSSPRHAVREGAGAGRQPGSGAKPLHIVVVLEASTRTLQRMLERSDCDVVVRQPVHPTALRLLVQRALFAGAERRQLERVAIGAPVKLKSGLFARAATLAEISLRGCGLVTGQRLSRGDAVEVILPATLTGAKLRSLRGSVVGVQPAPVGEAGGQSVVAVVFDRMTAPVLREVRGLMTAHGLGTTFKPEASAAAGAGPSVRAEAAKEAAKPASPRDRRKARRGVYEESILAQGSGRSHALIGCDLSASGMRVGFSPDLKIGMQLKLALYGQAGVPPVVVCAEVVRDGCEEDGFGLRFQSLPAPAQRRLESLVASLPALEPLGNTGQVVSEVIAQGASAQAAEADR